MADFDQGPSVNNITRRRGDTFPILFTLKDADEDPVPVTGWTFVFTVDESPEPEEETDPSDTEVFQRPGVIQDGPNGVVRVGPFDTSDVDNIGNFFYDLQGVDTDGNIRTVSFGEWNILQDITKV